MTKVFTIGRDANSDFKPPSRLVSRKHAELREDKHGWTLIDLGSANGTYINKAKIQESPLTNGDLVGFGDSRYTFQNGEFTVAGKKLSPSPQASDQPSLRRLVMLFAGLGLVAITLAATFLIIDTFSPEPITVLGQQPELPPADLEAFVAEMKNATVWIECGFGQGSGFAIDWSPEQGRETWILTNHHVIEECVDSDLSVVISTERFSTRGSVLMYSPSDYIDGSNFRQDLAIVTIDRFIPALPRAEKIGQGNWVMAIGNPQGLSGTVTSGAVARILDSSNTEILPYPQDWVLSDAPINLGNSGGPLVNNLGQVVGVNTLNMDGFEGLGFANGWPNACRELFTCSKPASW